MIRENTNEKKGYKHLEVFLFWSGVVAYLGTYLYTSGSQAMNKILSFLF